MKYTPFKWAFKLKYTRKKRLLALLLAVAMAVGLLPAMPEAATAYGASEILFDKLSPKYEPQRLPEVLF